MPHPVRPILHRCWYDLGLNLRFILRLVWTFRWSVLTFTLLVLGVGLILHLAYADPEISYIEACYSVFLLIFLEPYLDFPREWYLQPLFFLVPIIGLGAVADSVVRLGLLIFSRKSRLPEWQVMMASLQRNHTIIVGLGKVGYQIAQSLLELREPIVVIERPEATSDLLDELLESAVPVIRGDGRSPRVLEQAGVRHARAVILATSDDLTNLDAGLTARDLNSGARVVLRLFDESLAEKVRGAFALPAISTAQVVAPAFVAAATGRRLYQDFELAGRHLHLIDLQVLPGSGLIDQAVGRIQESLGVNIVMHHGSDDVIVNPGHELVLKEGDELLVIGPIADLMRLEERNQPDAARSH